MAKLNIGKIWDGIDGNKTKIGVAITAIGALAEIKYPEVGSQIKVLGEFIAGGGLTHGLWKWARVLFVK